MRMILKRAALIILTFAGSLACAQNVAFGPKGGLNLGKIEVNDPEATYESRTGYHAGIFFRAKSDKIAIQPEVLLYTQHGEIFSSAIGSAEESFTYITVPVMFKFYPALGFNVQAGPQFGFLIDGERNYDGVLFDGSQDIKDYYDATDIAVSTGLGYDFNFGLNLDFRYNIGVKDINNEADGEPAKSRVFMISLGWNFVR